MLTTLPLSLELGLIIATLLSITLIFFEKKLSIFKIILLFISSVIFLASTFSLGNNIYKIVFYPSYEATVTHVDEVEESDEDGDYIMYQPTYTFNDGQKDISIKSTMSTSAELYIGDKVKIAYKNGKFLEYVAGIFIFAISKLIGLSISFFILFIIMGAAIKKDFKIEKYGLLLVRVLFSLFLLMIIFGIFRKLWFVYLGEEYLSNIGILALDVVLLIAVYSLKALVSSYKIHEDENNVKDKKKLKKRKRNSKVLLRDSLKELNSFDSNLIALIGILFFSSIFSIIAINLYSDDGITFFVIIFGLIGIVGAFFSFYFYLSYRYFKNISLQLDTPIKKGVTLKGYFLLKKKTQKSTIFTVTLLNTHEVRIRNSEDGETKYKDVTLWEKEEKPSIEKVSKGIKLSFSFSTDNYKKGDLKLLIKAKVNWFKLSRSYTLITS